MQRRTIVVDSALARLEAATVAARGREHGVQIMPVEQAAARLAGGFLQPIPREALQDAVQQALATTDLGPLAPVQALAGTPRAATTTLLRVWDADIDLAGGNDRIVALATLEEAARQHLRASMRRPDDLVQAALDRIDHAPAVLGPVEVRRVPDLAPVYRPFVLALAERVEVRWVCGSRPLPDWVTGTNVHVEEPEPHDPKQAGVTCANPRHEAIEALRWARELIAAGTARPQEIAITTASPRDWDEHFLAMARDAELPVHFAHGRPALSRVDGQACAALAEIVLNGLSQDRLRRLIPLLKSLGDEADAIPGDWTRILPRDAPLTSLDRWRRHLEGVEEWPEGYDFARPLLELLETLERGPARAVEIGEALLRGTSLAIWRRALAEGPARALDVTLAGLRLPDDVDPAGAIVWGPTATIAGAPRPYTWMLGLTSRAWPRTAAEDPLLPDHVLPQEQLDPVPVPERDRRDFRALMGSARRAVVLSRSRRDPDGRQLGPSALWPQALAPDYLERSRVAAHVMSESDRLLARAGEFAETNLARSTSACWIDWHKPQVTAHDGLIRKNHPLVAETLDRPQSTGAIQKMLRDPIGYVWHEVLRWREPVEDQEPIALDALARGDLIHRVLEEATRELARGRGLTRADPAQVEEAARVAAETVASAWEAERPVPPAVVWQRTLAEARETVPAALAAEFGDGEHALPDQRSLAEVPFGQAGWRRPPDPDRPAPWDVNAPVTIPGTAIRITGRIDRLDLAADGSAAAVVDYKTGKPPPKSKPPELGGGKEVQRCLYAYAVQALLGTGVAVDARLVYPNAGRVLPLQAPGEVLTTLTGNINLGRANLLAGRALPGAGSEDDYNDLRFALPGDAKERYFRDKREVFNAALGDLVELWSLP